MANVIEYSIRANDEFSSVMDKQMGQMAKLQGLFAGLGIAAAAYGAVRLAEKSLENADAMGKAAERANLTTAKFTALSFAAEMAGVASDTFSMGLKNLNVAMAEGDATPAGRALEALGISARTADGELRNVGDVLYELSDAFAAGANDANKLKAVTDILGSKVGPQMLLFLNQGSDSMQKMESQAQKLGLVISDDFAKSANAVNDNLEMMSKVIDGSMNVAMQQLSPLIEEVTGTMIEFVTEGDGVAKAGEVIASGFRVIMTVGAVLIGVVKTLGTILGATFAAIVQVTTGDFSGAFETAKNIAVDSMTNISDTVKGVSDIWDEEAQAAKRATADNMVAGNKLRESMNAVTADMEKARKEQEALEKALEDTERAMFAQIATTGLTAAETKAYELKLKGATDEQLRQINAYASLQSAIDANKSAYERAMSIIDAQKTPMEKHIQQLDEINQLRRDGVITAEQHALAIEREGKAWDDAKGSTQQYKDQVIDAFAEMSTQLEDHFTHLGSVSYQIGSMMSDVAQTFIKGIGDSVAASIIEGKNLADSMTQVANQVLKTIISTLVQIGIQRLILAVVGKTAALSEGIQEMSLAMGKVYLNSFASAAAIPLTGWAIAPGVATANLAAATAGATAAMATGAGVGAAAGAFHGGMDFVPKETTYLLDKGERVLSPRQNRDLTDFMKNGNVGAIQDNTTIYVDGTSDRNAIRAEVQAAITAGHEQLIERLYREGRI